MDSVYLWVGKIVVWGVGGGAVWCFLGFLAGWYWERMTEQDHQMEIAELDPVQQLVQEVGGSRYSTVLLVVFWPLWIPLGFVTYLVARRRVMADVRAREVARREAEAQAKVA